MGRREVEESQVLGNWNAEDGIRGLEFGGQETGVGMGDAVALTEMVKGKVAIGDTARPMT